MYPCHNVNKVHYNFIIITLIGPNSIQCVHKKLRKKNAIKFVVIYDFLGMKMIFLCLHSMWYNNILLYLKYQHFSFIHFSPSIPLYECVKTIEMCEFHKCLLKLHNTIYVQINRRECERIKTYKCNICHIFYSVSCSNTHSCIHITYVLNFLRKCLLFRNARNIMYC